MTAGAFFKRQRQRQLQIDARVVFACEERAFNQDLIEGYFLEDFPFLCQNRVRSWERHLNVNFSNGSAFVSSPGERESRKFTDIQFG